LFLDDLRDFFGAELHGRVLTFSGVADLAYFKAFY
jgi:hypothetical protein